MRPVAIATIEKHYLLTNYGSFFQHYALRQVLARWGFTPFRVRADGEIASLGAMLTAQFLDCLRPFVWWLRRMPNRRTSVRQMRLRNKSYWIFRRDYLSLVGRLDEKPFYGDRTIGIRGGDQVFCPETEAQWLSAIRPGNPRLLYAASADWTDLGQRSDWQETLTSRLRSFTAVGIREEAGLELAQSVVPEGVPIRHVADPVQLLTREDFRAIERTKPVFKRPTLFCYLVNLRSAEDLRLSEYERLAKLLNCELRFVGIQGGELVIPRRYRTIYSPREFLRALDDAAYFMTNSYHGSVLALLYRKRFLSVRQNCLPGTNQNERQKELMHRFGLKDRWVDYRISAEEWQAKLDEEVDWESVDRQTTIWREESLTWLRSQL